MDRTAQWMGCLSELLVLACKVSHFASACATGLELYDGCPTPPDVSGMPRASPSMRISICSHMQSIALILIVLSAVANRSTHANC